MGQDVYSATGDPRIYATAEMVRRRNDIDANVCIDPECRLSGGYAHVGDCEACSCGAEHAREECGL